MHASTPLQFQDKRIKELNEENKQLKRKLGAAGITMGEDGVDLEISLDMMGMMGMGSSKGKPGESREMAERRAKQLQAIAKQTNDMIMQVLEDLGIEAQQGPDGRILLVSAFLLRPFRHRLARCLVCSFVVGGWMDGWMDWPTDRLAFLHCFY